MELDARLLELAGEVLEIDPQELGPDDGIGRTAGWTSLAHLNLIVAIEETFDIRLPTSRLPELTTLGKLQGELGRQGMD
ncbi:MAG: acyl carrier protein [Phycisphaerae bacterium]|nr:acyl carrier protein [Phycisphaerae bacterium]